MKSIFLRKIFVSIVLLFIVADSANPRNLEALASEKIDELRKLKEINFKNCCKHKQIPEECSKFCTYNFDAFSNPMEVSLLNTVKNAAVLL